MTNFDNDTIRTIAQPYRCLVTTNPVGTDTERLGFECDCQVCRASREIDRLNAVIENEAIVSRDALAEVERLRRCSPGNTAATVVSKLPTAEELARAMSIAMNGGVRTYERYRYEEGEATGKIMIQINHELKLARDVLALLTSG